MNLRKKLILLVVMLFAFGILLNCSYNSAKTKPKSITLNKGEKYSLPIKYIKKYKVTSNKKKVASVNKKGVVSALKKGSCVIKASSKEKVYQYKVIVKDVQPEPQENPAVVLSMTEKSEEKSEPQVHPTFLPSKTAEPDTNTNTAPEPSYAPPGGIVSVLKGEVVECTETEDGKLNYKVRITESTWYDDSIKYAYVLMPDYKKCEPGSKIYVIKNITDRNDVFDGDTVAISSGYVMG